MLVSIGVILNVLFQGVGVWASLRHFSRMEREPPGASFLTVATTLGISLNAWLALRQPRAGDFDAAFGIALSLAAFAIFFAAIRATRLGELSLAFSERTPGVVVDNGIYSVIRHPFYSSYIIHWLGWLPLTSFKPLSWLIAAIMIAAYTIAAYQEERLLTARLGKPYAALMRRTWRFIPWIH